MEQFDFATLTETFVDNNFDMSAGFFSVIMSNMLVLLSSCRAKGDDREA